LLSWLDFTRRNPSGDDVLIDELAVSGGCTTLSHCLLKPFIVIDRTRQEIQSDPLGAPAGFRGEAIQLCREFWRNM
jgi:hypothetical protein